MKEYRKSAVDLTDLAIGIVILGIAVSIGSVILVNIRNSQITNTATYTVSNEAVTVANLKAGTTLSTVWGQGISTCNNNSQAGLVIDSANWTTSISSSNGLISIANATSEFIDKPWSCNYTVYNASDPRYTLPNSAAVGLGEYGNWFKIIVIVGVAAVVLALIFMVFGGKSVGGGDGGIGGTY